MEPDRAVVRPCGPADERWKRAQLDAAWDGTVVARKGVAIDAAELPALIVERGGRRLGLLTYRVTDDALEVVTIQTDQQGTGLGRALLDGARREAEQSGCSRLWLVTTDNNVRAIGLYRRWGLRLSARHVDGVERSRAVKPGIPMVDDVGVALRDELEFEFELRLSPDGPGAGPDGQPPVART